eukprot:m.33166 g.33166  ORF g.33166 m.33166 type:complete len:51 (+) comp9592_c0_seq1:279-431(+)
MSAFQTVIDLATNPIVKQLVASVGLFAGTIVVARNYPEALVIVASQLQPQ